MIRRPPSSTRTDTPFPYTTPFRSKRPSTHYGKTPEPETPYQKAVQIWDDRIGSARVQAKNWRLAAFGSLLLAGGFAGALVWQSARGTIVPWVVQVDQLGQAQAVEPAVADYRPTRSEERRVGKECVSTCRSRWSPDH